MNIISIAGIELVKWSEDPTTEERQQIFAFFVNQLVDKYGLTLSIIAAYYYSQVAPFHVSRVGDDDMEYFLEKDEATKTACIQGALIEVTRII